MADNEVIEIRRYPNRRLYDRSRGRYVTLGDLEELVRSGRTIEVRDSKTGEDLTRQILTQILIERYPERMDLMPTALLHTMLQANDLAVEFLGNAMRQSLTALEALQHAGGSPFGTPLGWMSAFFPGMAHPIAPAASSPPSAAPTATAAAATIAHRLAALEARIARLEGDLHHGADHAGTSDAAGADVDDSTHDQGLDALERRLNHLERGGGSRPRRRGKLKPAGPSQAGNDR